MQPNHHCPVRKKKLHLWVPITNLPIYSIEYRQPLENDLLRWLSGSLPEAIREKAGRYKRWEDAHGCLLGKCLLLAALRDLGLSGNLNDLQYTPYDRPYLAGGPDFNISHSGNRVVCIIGDGGRVGIDLEEIRELDIFSFREQFTAREWAAIHNAEAPLTAFYHYWTAKEAVSKADGRGLNLSLTEELMIEGNASIRLGEEEWSIHPVSFFRGYACNFCSNKSFNNLIVKYLSSDNLIGLLAISGETRNNTT
jgi:4'-phosphopantetheinyl transferase